MKNYDTIIIGGGLSGLASAIHLAKRGFSVAVYEKKTYPFHKVCGEYISMESWDYLSWLGVELEQMNLPIINKLEVTSPKGFTVREDLALGGFGISRYTLDERLAGIATGLGVDVFQGLHVRKISKKGEEWEITEDNPARTKVLMVAQGRGFSVKKKAVPAKVYVGVKYHIKTEHPKDVISLHNFKDGYCGISQVDDDKHCLCYITAASNVKKVGNDISRLEEEILGKNPHIKRIFSTSTKLFDAPKVISNITFEPKKMVADGMLCIGDSAGCIAPLAGNGMSMGLHGAMMASYYVELFLRGTISHETMTLNYSRDWQSTFNARVYAGRQIQHAFGNPTQTEVFLRMLSLSPFIRKKLISLTHGEPFFDESKFRG